MIEIPREELLKASDKFVGIPVICEGTKIIGSVINVQQHEDGSVTCNIRLIDGTEICGRIK